MFCHATKSIFPRQPSSFVGSSYFANVTNYRPFKIDVPGYMQTFGLQKRKTDNYKILNFFANDKLYFLLQQQQGLWNSVPVVQAEIEKENKNGFLQTFSVPLQIFYTCFFANIAIVACRSGCVVDFF